MSKLVLVDTPAQAKILADHLGEGWRVEVCQGNLRDLPAGELGIDPAADFRPNFVIAPGKGNLVRRLMKAIRECEAIYAATPPVRAGELLAGQVLALSPDTQTKPVYRLTLDALTPDNIRAAFAAPRPLNMHWIEAELAQRLVDRLAGYAINAAARERGDFHPISRTAMIALCRLAARENARSSFTVVEQWTLRAHLTMNGSGIAATLYHASGIPLRFPSMEVLEDAKFSLEGLQYWIEQSGVREVERPAPLPYTLTTLLVAAQQKLGLPPNETLELVDTLYDAGWITHPLGNITPALIEAARAYLRREYGTDYLTAAPAETLNGLASADVNRVPEDLPGNGAALYGLIWRRFMAAIMPPARLRQSGARIRAGVNRQRLWPLVLRAEGEMVAFDGWLRALPDEQPALAPFFGELQPGAAVHFNHFTVEETTAKPPERFSAASFVAQYGAAYPAVWATALDELVTAAYVQNQDGQLVPTETGLALAEWLIARFPSVVSEQAVSDLELNLEHIAAGERGRVEVVRHFWNALEAVLRPQAATAPACTVGEYKPIVLRPVEE